MKELCRSSNVLCGSLNTKCGSDVHFTFDIIDKLDEGEYLTNHGIGMVYHDIRGPNLLCGSSH